MQPGYGRFCDASQTFPAALIDNIQQPYAAAIAQAIMYKIHRPAYIGDVLDWFRLASWHRRQFFPLAANAKPCGRTKPENPLVVDFPALTP
jgi:hypothetical protein